MCSKGGALPMKVSLPSHEPVMTALPWIRNLFTTLGDDIYLWAYNYFIQMVGDVYIEGASAYGMPMLLPISYSECPCLFTKTSTHSFIVTAWDKFSDRLKFAINSGYYALFVIPYQHHVNIASGVPSD